MSALAVATAQARSRQEMDKRLWELLAYGARYGMQPLSELKAMTLAELGRFVSEISEIVKSESTPSSF